MSGPAPTLAGQMLCASVYAYAIQPDGSFDSSYPPYDTASGLSQPDALFAGIGELDLDACLVGLNTAQNAVVVAFRGTLPPSEKSVTTALDWIDDFYAETISVPGIPGKVHAGFWDSVDKLWAQLLPKVQALMKNNTLPLYITGHSKGGAMASLAAMRFATSENIKPAGIFTFASPMPGDQDFANGYLFNSIHTRYEYQDDIVPHLPPDATLVTLLQDLPDIGKYFDFMQNWDYTPVGTLQFINWSDQFQGESVGLDIERVYHLLKLMAELQFGTILGDHGADCGDGYMTAINPTGVCTVSRTVDIGQLMAKRGIDVQRFLGARASHPKS